MLDILIPHYHEDFNLIKHLLDSIGNQIGIDFNNITVTIVNDGNDVILPEEELHKYPYKINYFINEHAGVSATRQKAFDITNGEYVMFCDADDMFFNLCGLYLVFLQIAKGEFDMMLPPFLEEVKSSVLNSPIPTKMAYVLHNADYTFVHGKVYRRQYIIDNNIKWRPDFTINEDSYFNYIAFHCAEKPVFTNDAFYLWRWRDDSTARRDNDFNIHYYNMLVDSAEAAVDVLSAKQYLEKAANCAAMFLYDTYFLLNCREWLDPKNAEWRNNTEKRISRYYKKFQVLIESVPVPVKLNILQQSRQKAYTKGLMFESYTYDAWIEHIKNLSE